jgi:hypothetical protein
MEGDMAHALSVVEDAVRAHLLADVEREDALSPMFRDALASATGRDSSPNVDLVGVLVAYCVEYEIWPQNIAACRSLIETGWCMLHTGSPVFMMGYSPARQCFIASVDTEIPDGWQKLSRSKATLLLLLLASEEHDLPEHADAWGVVHFKDPMLFEFDSQNESSVRAYRSYLRGNRNELDEYDLKLCRSFTQVRDFMRLS